MNRPGGGKNLVEIAPGSIQADRQRPVRLVAELTPDSMIGMSRWREARKSRTDCRLIGDLVKVRPRTGKPERIAAA